ncbi:YadA-like family protein [Stenotrophomonas bentonitica]|uniref:YadA-like family protein n=1 Tax=Stenotrophomonas bentonitica TaxID=1450134 RepID=UPI00345E3EDD
MDRSWYRIALRGVSRASFARSLLLAGAALGVFLSMSSPVMAQTVCTQTGGAAPTATGAGAFACGDAASAGGANATAVGNGSSAGDQFGTAVGRNSSATGFASTAIGYNVKAIGRDSMAFGVNSNAEQEGSMVFGVGTTSTAQNGIAIGQGASVTGTSSIALGAGAVAAEANTVSLGVAGSERRIVNLAAGTADTDGVNVSQLKQSAADTLAAANTYTDEQADATLAEANTYTDTVAGDTLVAANQYTDQQINQIGQVAASANDALEQFKAQVQDRFTGVDQRINAMEDSLRVMDRRISRQGAMAAAMTQSLGMPEVGENFLGAGVGWSEGENAFAASFRRRFTEHVTGSVGASRSGSESAVAVGAGVSW